MEIEFEENKIVFNKVINSLDQFVIDFVRILNKNNIRYVIISGYVAILFGRTRETEDVDMFIEKINFETFRNLWDDLQERFECLNTSNVVEAYNEYLNDNTAIRFSLKGDYVPNIELKFPKMDSDFWSLKEKKEVAVNEHTLFISPIEMQICFKLVLGTDKDIEDAQHLYTIFKQHLDASLVEQLIRKFNIQDMFKRHLK